VALFDQNDAGTSSSSTSFRGSTSSPLLASGSTRRRGCWKVGRSKDKWIKIAGYLQILWDHHLITPSGRYLFAVALIRQSNRDLSPPARRSNLGCG
jgi:hypothetical protein